MGFDSDTRAELKCQVYHYWYQPRRDSTLARVAIGSATVASLCQVAIANYSMAQLIKFDHRYIGYVFLDWVSEYAQSQLPDDTTESPS